MMSVQGGSGVMRAYLNGHTSLAIQLDGVDAITLYYFRRFVDGHMGVVIGSGEFKLSPVSDPRLNYTGLAYGVKPLIFLTGCNSYSGCLASELMGFFLYYLLIDIGLVFLLD